MRLLSPVLLFLTLSPLLATQSRADVDPVPHLPPEPAAVAAERPLLRTPPAGAEIVNPAEFCRADGALLAWSGWALSFISEITYTIAEDYTVFMLVRNAAVEQSAYNYLSIYGVNMENVVFIHDAAISATSMWIRDYGPFCIYEDGVEAIVDFHYGTYPSDDWVSQTIATHFDLPFYHSNLLHHGGNHITDGNSMAFCSTNLYNYNPGWSEEEIRGEFAEYLGVDSLVVYARMLGDLTGHTDMFVKLLNDTLFVVGEYAQPEDAYPGDYELLNDLADYLGSLHNADGRSFYAARLPMLPIVNGPYGRVNRTYTNSLILNDKVLVPTYADSTDDVALQIYADLMPGYEITGIDSRFIIDYLGAVHCVTNCLHSANPLIVLHEPITRWFLGSAPQIGFRINPRFGDTQASVFYRLASQEEFSEVAAEFVQGAWVAVLPVITEDFCYYIAGTAVSGETVMEITLPDGAPDDVFEVGVIDPSGVVADGHPRLLLRNSPNPFAAGTRIGYAVPNGRGSARVRLSVHDAAGRLIRTLVAADQPGGAYELTWDGTDHAARRVDGGVYFYRLCVNNAQRAQAMILLK